MGYSETDLVLKEKDGTIKLATIGVTAEQFDLAIAHIEPPKENILERGIQLIGKIGIGKMAIAAHPKEVPVLLVDSVVCAPHKQNVIAHTTLDKLKGVVENKQSEMLLTECAEEYLKLMGRKHPEYVSPLALTPLPQFDDPIIVDGSGSGSPSAQPKRKINGRIRKSQDAQTVNRFTIISKRLVQLPCNANSHLYQP